MPFSAFVFRLRGNDATPRTLYLRLRTDMPSILAARLWSPTYFVASKTLLYGIQFGVLGFPREAARMSIAVGFVIAPSSST